MHILNYFYIFLLTLSFSLIMVPMLRRWAIEKQEYDIPDQRKVHVHPVPRLGGVAIFMGVLFALLTFNEVNHQVRAILAGGLILFITGLVDDLHGLSSKKKFLGQIVACIVTMSVGDLYISQLGDLFGLGNIVLPIWLAYPFTLFAVVGVINAINLLDGLDGLAGGFSVISLGAFLSLGSHHAYLNTSVLCIALIGGLVGFLRYNAHPATIFMGDAGSLTVGFLLGFLAVLMTQQPGSGIRPVVPFIILGLPILDTLRVMVSRMCKKQHPFAPDRTHVHHKLLDLGLNHRFAVLAIHGLSLAWAVVALALRQQPEPLLFCGYVGSMTCFYAGLKLLNRNRQKLSFVHREAAESELYCAPGSEIFTQGKDVSD